MTQVNIRLYTFCQIGAFKKKKKGKKKNKLQQTSKTFELCSILFTSVRVNDADAGR